jgi:hypothetical protein
MKKIIYASIAVIGLLASCNKTDNNPPIQVQQFEINSTSSTLWKYFSFAKNDTITVADPATSTEWDLAFQRYRIRTNSSLTGAGQGSAANSYQKLQAGFDAVKSVPDTTTFTPDESIQIAVQQGYATYVVNPELYTWFTLELGGANGTQIVPTDYVYIVKTATGKYAKVWFKSYYNNSNLSGYVTFEYKYQPDGSKNIE